MSETCECSARKALESVKNIGHEFGCSRQYGRDPCDCRQSLIDDAIAAPCPREGLREQLASYRVTTEDLLGIEIPEAEGPLEFALCLMRAVQDANQ